VASVFGPVEWTGLYLCPLGRGQQEPFGKGWGLEQGRGSRLGKEMGNRRRRTGFGWQPCLPVLQRDHGPHRHRPGRTGVRRRPPRADVGFWPWGGGRNLLSSSKPLVLRKLHQSLPCTPFPGCREVSARRAWLLHPDSTHTEPSPGKAAPALGLIRSLGSSPKRQLWAATCSVPVNIVHGDPVLLRKR
jgi:hypothetical protein